MPRVKDPSTGKFIKGANKDRSERSKKEPRPIRGGEVGEVIKYKRLFREAVAGRDGKGFKKIAAKLSELAKLGNLEAIKLVLQYVIGKPAAAVTLVELPDVEKDDPVLQKIQSAEGAAEFYVSVLQSEQTSLTDKMKARRELDLLVGNIKDGDLGTAEEQAREAREFFLAAMKLGVPSNGNGAATARANKRLDQHALDN